MYELSAVILLKPSIFLTECSVLFNELEISDNFVFNSFELFINSLYKILIYNNIIYNI